jgi:hypothetical protein
LPVLASHAVAGGSVRCKPQSKVQSFHNSFSIVVAVKVECRKDTRLDGLVVIQRWVLNLVFGPGVVGQGNFGLIRGDEPELISFMRCRINDQSGIVFGVFHGTGKAPIGASRCCTFSQPRNWVYPTKDRDCRNRQIVGPEHPSYCVCRRQIGS